MANARHITNPARYPHHGDGNEGDKPAKDPSRKAGGYFKLTKDEKGVYHIYARTALRFKGALVTRGTLEALKEFCAALETEPVFHF